MKSSMTIAIRMERIIQCMCAPIIDLLCGLVILGEFGFAEKIYRIEINSLKYAVLKRYFEYYL